MYKYILKAEMLTNLCKKLLHQFYARLKTLITSVGVGHLFRILPPLFPFLRVVGSNGQITNRGVKPHIEYLQRQQESHESHTKKYKSHNKLVTKSHMRANFLLMRWRRWKN